MHSPVIFVPSTSQFNFKTVEHENKHVQQFTSGMLSDLYNISSLMAVLSPLTDTTEQGLLVKINSTFNTWLNGQDMIYSGRLKAAEREAYMISDPINPRFLYQNCGRF